METLITVQRDSEITKLNPNKRKIGQLGIKLGGKPLVLARYPREIIKK
jgi:hypothetical protein